jgi:hypothetical protein
VPSPATRISHPSDDNAAQAAVASCPVGQLVAPAWFTPRTLQLYATGRPMTSVAEDDDQ